MSASKDTKPNGEKELRLKHLYGRIPRKGDLLAHQLEVSKIVQGPVIGRTWLTIAVWYREGSISTPVTFLSPRHKSLRMLVR